MNKKKLLDAPTEDCWGFYGTIQNNEDLNEQDATSVWNQVFAILQNASWKPTDIAIRNFLRGRFGRHFADATTFYEGSLEKRIQQTASEKC